MAGTPSYRTADATVSSYTAAAVTPSDATALRPTRGIYIGGSGDVKVDMAVDGEAITFAGVTAGSILPIQVVKIYETDTTATDMVALY